MACTRDRIINFLKSLGIDVNVGKNKARGNKGFFCAGRDCHRIDVAKGLSEAAELKVLVHEFAHYIHYGYDKTLKDLSFIFPDLSPEIMEELISVTVECVDKNEIEPFFIKKAELAKDIKRYYNCIASIKGDFSINKPLADVEKFIKDSKYRHLLKYDKVRVTDGFGSKIYSIDEIDSYGLDNCVKNYILLKSRQRMVKRINSKISRLNRYYNNPSELFSRAIEKYILNPDELKNRHNLLYNEIDKTVKSGKIQTLTNFVKVL